MQRFDVNAALIDKYIVNNFENYKNKPHLNPILNCLHVVRAVLWIRNDLFRIRIQLWIFQVPDPDPGISFGSMRIRIQPLLIR